MLEELHALATSEIDYKEAFFYRTSEMVIFKGLQAINN
jgi:hypothetical protein